MWWGYEYRAITGLQKQRPEKVAQIPDRGVQTGDRIQLNPPSAPSSTYTNVITIILRLIVVSRKSMSNTC